jgi:hypothetical protein
VKRLVFVTTPLQALVASEICKLEPADDTLVYLAGSPSPKNQIYFERFAAEDKVFGGFRKDGRSQVLTIISRYLALPRRIKRRGFDRALISSFNHLAYALLQGRERWPADTFDDGTLNIDRDVFLPFLQDEPRSNKLVRRLMGAQLAKDVYLHADRHFSIFDRTLALARTDSVVELDLFRPKAPAAAFRPVRVMLGTPVAATCSAMGRMDLLEKRNRIYDSILGSVEHDIFLPHPAEQREAHVGERFSGFRQDVDQLIAEELILRLSAAGYTPVIYGFSSTSLLTLRNVGRVINLLLPEEPRAPYMDAAELPTYLISGEADVARIPR